MRYEMLDIQPRGADDIVTLCQKPNPFERLLGAHEEQLTAYGHDDTWWTMDGAEVNHRLSRFLRGVWQEHPRQVRATQEAATRRDQKFDVIDEAGEESFPASDPPSYTRRSA